MFKRSLATFVALGALAGVMALPAHAQDHMWTSARPDAVQASGIVGDMVLPSGAFDLQYTFSQENFSGVQFGTTEIPFVNVLEIYESSPFQRRNRVHRLNLAYGLTGNLTVRVAGAFAEYSRDVLDQDLFLFATENDGLTDLEVEAMLTAYNTDALRSHLSLGVEVPLGSTDEVGVNAIDGTAILPYRMQLGTGSYAIVPGVTAQVQNEHGTVGAQVKARLRVNDNDRDYRWGDDVTANIWAALHLNEVIAMHTGVRAYREGSIEGFDAAMDPSRDPGEDVFLSAGTKVVIPLGINFRLTEGVLAGNTFGFEFLWPVHQDYENFRLTAERGFNITWRRTFGM